MEWIATSAMWNPSQLPGLATDSTSVQLRAPAPEATSLVFDAVAAKMALIGQVCSGDTPQRKILVIAAEASLPDSSVCDGLDVRVYLLVLTVSSVVI